eukprot:evm.model.scf_599.4 EVM.evm.TU.scf_599.4   scf_599:22769-26568(+)
MAAARPTDVWFYFDTLSPYSWLAFEVLCRYERLWDLRVHHVPINLPQLMAKIGNDSPPAAIKPRARGYGRDLARSSAFFGVKINGLPSNFMAASNRFTSHQAQRLLIVACDKHGDDSKEAKNLIREFFSTFHSRLSGTEVVVDDDLMKECCIRSGICAEEAEAMIRVSATEEIKRKLKANTMEAAEKGAFGVPTMVWDSPKLPLRDRMFFGSDRFEQIAFLLGKDWRGPVPERSKL